MGSGSQSKVSLLPTAISADLQDVYDVKGVITSAGSRPYGEVWGEANTTASSILRLEELGGHIVGKSKTAA